LENITLYFLITERRTVGRKEKRREEVLVCFEGAGKEAIHTGGGAVAGEKKEELVWCRVSSCLQNRMITKLI